jgi:hypothetical protein
LRGELPANWHNHGFAADLLIGTFSRVIAMRKTSSLVVIVLVAATWAVVAGRAGADTLISNGSVGSPFSQNSANEPAVAIDPIHPNVIAVGSNDNIDMAACNDGDDHDCPYSPAVGSSGIYFSTNAGASWTQPTYSGLSARGCLGIVGDSDPRCVETTGPIGTVPNYSEAGLRSDGDPGVAFGPRPGRHGRFSWLNGSRLYYVDLASALAGVDPAPFPGYEAVAVSHVDDVAAARSGTQAAWSTPKIASAQAPDTFSDKPQIWADNASSSAHFGNVYVCYDPYTYDAETGAFDIPPLNVGVSTDGGDTFAQHTVVDAEYAAGTQPGYSRVGCTIRTDSNGKVYVFAYQQPPQAPGVPITGQEVMITSSDGGTTWSAPVKLFDANDQCSGFEPSIFRCTIDGVGGERDDLGAAPSVDIANGAPLGLDATNRIVMTWTDGGTGLGDERVKFTTSGNGGLTWSPRRDVQQPASDRGYYSAAAISPDGRDIYLVYNAFTAPFTTSAEGPSNAHPSVGVMEHANVGPLGVVGPFGVVSRGASGDARGSSQNNLAAEFLGDYVYADATRTYGIGVWNDVRNAADCPAVDEYRQELHEEAVATGGPTAEPQEPPTQLPGDSGEDDDEGDAPAVQQECPAGFGNGDIYGATVADPTP